MKFRMSRLAHSGFYRTCGVFVLIGLLPVLGACDQGGSSGTNGTGDMGLLVSRALDTSSKVLKLMPQLIVYDSGGKELRRIDLPGLPQDVVATPASNQVLVHAGDGKIYMVDAMQGITRTLDIPETAQKDLLLRTVGLTDDSGKNWILLRDVDMGHAYLVNLTSGKSADLIALTKSNFIYPNAPFHADDDSLVLESDTGLWLVPTASPDKARKLGGGVQGYSGRLSDDGKQVVYGRPNKDGSEVVVEQVDGTGSKVIATGKRGMEAVFVPGQKRLVLLYQDKAVLHSLDDSTEQTLFTYTKAPLPVLFSDDGSKLLFSNPESSARKWEWIDLKSGSGSANSVKPLDTLDGFGPLKVRQAKERWVTFVDNPSGDSLHFAGLDMQNGATSEALTLNGKNLLFLNESLSPDSASSLITANVGGNNQLWLLSNKGGAARMLAEGTSASGAFSPDGRQIVISKAEVAGGVFTSKLSIAATEGIAETGGTGVREIGNGYGAVWVNP